MKKTLLLILLILPVFTTTMKVFGQSHFQPVVENGIFFLYVGSNGPDVSKIEIFNSDGDMVKSCDMAANREKSVDCKDLPSGQYHVMIHSGNNEYYTPLTIKNEEPEDPQ